MKNHGEKQFKTSKLDDPPVSHSGLSLKTAEAFYLALTTGGTEPLLKTWATM